MSIHITEAMVKQYSANVFHLSQQKESRLRSMVPVETQRAEVSFYDAIGPVTAWKHTGRHQDTVYADTPHSRRAVTLNEYVYADLCDKEDKIKIIMNPESEYAKAASMALGRAIDNVIIAAALGNAYSGKEGTVAVPLANINKIAAFDGATTTGVRLNIKTLRAVKKKFNKNEVDKEPIHFILAAEQLDDLLATTEVTSADYNTVRALVNGQIDTFMGFKFIRTELLPITKAVADADFPGSFGAITYNVTDGSVGAGTGTLPVGARRCFAMAPSGFKLAMGIDMNTKIDVLPTKNYSTQIYASMMLGAVRLEEVKVVEILCDE